jgi:hypothetical protein
MFGTINVIFIPNTQTTKKIKYKIMKTKMNVNQIAQMSFASTALFFFAGMMPLQAEIKSNYSNNQEISAAAGRLDNLNSEIETSIRFVAPAVDINAEALESEVNQAVERLDNLNLAIEDSIRFQAPEAHEAENTL